MEMYKKCKCLVGFWYITTCSSHASIPCIHPSSLSLFLNLLRTQQQPSPIPSVTFMLMLNVHLQF